MITPEQAVKNVERRVAEMRLQHEWFNKEMGGLPVQDRTNQIHSLFEGLCPTCGSKVTLVRVGGIPKFLDEMVFMGDHEINAWEKTQSDDGLGDSGGVEFECENEHKHYVGYSFACGDWH